MNILPIKYKNLTFTTPIGDVCFNPSNSYQDLEIIMFNHKSIRMTLSKDGNSTIRSKEFMNDHWIVTVTTQNERIRVAHPLVDHFNIGDSCYLTFNKSSEVTLFPGAIKAILS